MFLCFGIKTRNWRTAADSRSKPDTPGSLSMNNQIECLPALGKEFQYSTGTLTHWITVKDELRSVASTLRKMGNDQGLSFGSTVILRRRRCNQKIVTFI